MRTKYSIATLAALLLTGCAEYSENWFIAGGGYVGSATIAALDRKSREVTLRGEDDGSTFTVTAGSRVRNLPELAAGDRVEVWFEASRVLAMFDPADHSKGATSYTAEYEANYGAGTPPPMIVTFVSSNGFFLLRTPDGFTRPAEMPYDLLPIAERLEPGNRVLVSMTGSEAVKITKVAPR